MKYKLAIFDMDGTILNTLEDLGDSLNAVLAMAGHRSDYTTKDAGCFFGSGVRVACQRALAKEAGMDYEGLSLIGTKEGILPAEVTDAEADRIENAFTKYYPEHCAIKTAPFDGIAELLMELKSQGLKLAVASNKINIAVQELSDIHFRGIFDRAIGVDETIRRKPYPDMLESLMSELNSEPDETVLVGDTEIDMMTAENAGIDCIMVNWGFRSESFLKGHGAKELARNASDILEMMKEDEGYENEG